MAGTVTRLLRWVAGSGDRTSLAVCARRRRFELFRRLVEPLPTPVRILDVGGTANSWQTMAWMGPKLDVMLFNTFETPGPGPGLTSVVGDARDMACFRDGQFDVVFSNSVIEHVGRPTDQQQFAREVRRVGKAYFVQTPNYFFPLEPHFLFPSFQFLPLGVRAWLLCHFSLPGYRRRKDADQAARTVGAVRLLTELQFIRLFPEATIWRERVLGLTKSFVVYHGFRMTGRARRRFGLPPAAGLSHCR